MILGLHFLFGFSILLICCLFLHGNALLLTFRLFLPLYFLFIFSLDEDFFSALGDSTLLLNILPSLQHELSLFLKFSELFQFLDLGTWIRTLFNKEFHALQKWLDHFFLH